MLNEAQQTKCKVLAYRMFEALRQIPDSDPQIEAAMKELVMQHLNQFIHGERGGIESTCTEIKDA